MSEVISEIIMVRESGKKALREVRRDVDAKIY
jgi:hypothetical protein